MRGSLGFARLKTSGCGVMGWRFLEMCCLAVLKLLENMLPSSWKRCVQFLRIHGPIIQ